MKSDDLKRINVSPSVISGAATATSIVITRLSVTGPIRGDVQIVDDGRLIVGADPDSGSRGILSPVALQGYGVNGANSFSLWFSSVEGHTAGDMHLGNRESAHLRYDQSTGTLGLYTAGGVGVIMDNDGSFTAGDPNGPHVLWDIATDSLKIMAGLTTVAAEFMSDGSAELGRMLLRDVLTAGDVDGPAIHLGRFVTGSVESSEIIATDTANNPWFHIVAGGDTPNGGYFSLGQQGNFENRLTFDGEKLAVNGMITAGPGSVLVGPTVIGDGGTSNYAQFDATGHLTFTGTAKPWTDMLIEPTARTTGANAPTFEKWYDDAAGTSRGVFLYSFDDAAGGSEKEVFFNLQMSHAWDGGNIQFHVHWIGAVDDTTATPRWGLEYVFKEPGAVYGDSTIIYAVGNHLSEADITANKHYITAFAAISPGSTADDLSSVLIGRLFRDSANAADTYNAVGAKCGLLYIDAHYQLARIGSTDEYTA